MKPRIVVDTNVLLSGLFFEKGNEAEILRYVLVGRVRLLASLESLEELRETLSRPRFQLSAAEALATFQIILSRCEITITAHEAEVKCRDPDDQKFLDCAVTGRADYPVTGDRDLLDIRRVGQAIILTTAQLIKELKKTS